jgi:hypothetical protein
MAPQQFDRLEHAPARTADHVDAAADHHLRRIHPIPAEPVGIDLLAPRAVLEAEAVGPAEPVPVGDVEAERQDAVLLRQLAQKAIRRRARIAPL